jgi:hypothetical protein
VAEKQPVKVLVLPKNCVPLEIAYLGPDRLVYESSPADPGVLAKNSVSIFNLKTCQQERQLDGNGERRAWTAADGKTLVLECMTEGP